MLNWIILHIPIYIGATTPADCDADRAKTFLGIFPTWYKYIKDYQLQETKDGRILGCGFGNGIDAIVWSEYAMQVGLAVIDILLRAGALAAVIFIIMGGYKYMSSQGEPKSIEEAMATIVNAVMGLGIVLLASVLVAFIGNRLGG